jgi:serine/threonine protein kinase/cytochrome c-type biogenesis protein CcmH/NrfG
MIGKEILHYRILEKLGEGGMGIVYLAEDTKLKRQVAIKFLPGQVSANEEECQRFQVEAQAAAALNHPNITQIYAIEEADDQIFIVMEYIEGKELKELINTPLTPPSRGELKKSPFEGGARRAGDVLSIDQILNYATQIAEGLQAAHKKGIVHRDIKSSNIMITEEGQVKIMDFGLAKVGEGAQLTKEQSTLGTAAYMSPEQTRGEEVDQRSDIWSFGVVLYEMLTGLLPFKGDYEQAVLYAMMNEEPEPVKKYNPMIPDSLVSITAKTLEKDLSGRYQNVSEVLGDLEKTQSGDSTKIENASSITIKRNKKLIIAAAIALIVLFALLTSYFLNNESEPSSSVTMEQTRLDRVAILPFSNLKPDPETDYLGYALADQIIGALSYVKSIAVRPSSAMRKYNNKAVDIHTIGDELQVDYILAGNYLKQGIIVRLNVELVKVTSNELIWREVVNEKYENTFRLQDIVSEKIINGLKVQFTAKEKEMINADIPQNPLAYEYYLKGISYQYTTLTNQLAVEMLEKSIELDSTFAPAYDELGNRHHRLANYKFGGMQQIQLAEQYLREALSLNPELLRALGQLALIYTELSKTEEAIQITKKMLAINPNNPDAHFSLGYIYRYVGMLEESERECDMAIRLDPNQNFRSAGTTYLYSGKYEKALRAFNLDPESSFSLSWKGQLYLRQDQKEKAIEYFDEVIASDSNSTSGYWSLAGKAYLEGHKAEGVRAIKRIENTNPTDGEVWYNLANTYGLLESNQNCVNALKNAINGGFYNYPLMLTDTFFDSVRDDPEFREVLDLAKEKYEAFKKNYPTTDVNKIL